MWGNCRFPRTFWKKYLHCCLSFCKPRVKPNILLFLTHNLQKKGSIPSSREVLSCSTSDKSWLEELNKDIHRSASARPTFYICFCDIWTSTKLVTLQPFILKLNWGGCQLDLNTRSGISHPRNLTSHRDHMKQLGCPGLTHFHQTVIRSSLFFKKRKEDCHKVWGQSNHFIW